MSYGNAKLDRYFFLIHKQNPLSPEVALGVIAMEFFLSEDQLDQLIKAISEC